MSPQDEIDLHIEEIGGMISAAEEWAEQYRKDPDTFDKLVKGERKIDTAMRKYLKAVSKNVPDWVNWDDYAAKLEKLSGEKAKQAAAVTIKLQPSAGDDEPGLLFEAVAPGIKTVSKVGVQAGLAIYKRSLGQNTITKLVAQAAEDYAGTLAKNLGETTLNMVRESVSNSLERGLDQFEAADALSNYINNPVRADVIAHTEAVNAYSLGLREYGKATNAADRTWQSQPDAIDGCKTELDGQTVPMDKPYQSDEFGELDGPAAHPWCCCGEVINYPDDV